MTVVAAVLAGAGCVLVGVAFGLWLERRAEERWTADEAERWLERR